MPWWGQDLKIIFVLDLTLDLVIKLTRGGLLIFTYQNSPAESTCLKPTDCVMRISLSDSKLQLSVYSSKSFTISKSISFLTSPSLQ